MVTQINQLFLQYCSEPTFVIIDVRPGVEGNPTTAYIAVDEVEGEGKEIQRVFKHISCTIEADEPEQVFVSYLHQYVNSLLLYFFPRSVLSTYCAI